MNNMTITTAQYLVIAQSITVIQATIDGEVLQVPEDPDNRHYQAILEWVEAGNTIQEAE